MTEHKTKKAFTLVELIIVITILAVLATMAFVSFSEYTKNSRDSVRLTSLKNIETSLRGFQIQTGNYPEPDDKILISSGTQVINYQGNVGKTVSKIAKLSNPVDPLDKTFYTYSISGDKKRLQLGAIQEKTIAYFGNQAFAEDISARNVLVQGDSIGIFYDEQKTPIHRTFTALNIATYTGTSISAIVTNKITLKSNFQNLLDLKNDEYVKAYYALENKNTLFQNKKVLIIQSNTIEPKLKNYYMSGLFNVVIDDSVDTVAKVKAYNPDIVVCDYFAWACHKSWIYNELYNQGYTIVTHGNDTPNYILPIKNSSYTNTPAGNIISTKNHFMSTGWQSLENSYSDTRQMITEINPKAISIANDIKLNVSEVVYLEEPGKGKWLHIQTSGNPDSKFLDRAHAWMLR